MEAKDRIATARILYKIFLMSCENSGKDPNVYLSNLGFTTVPLLEDLRGGGIITIVEYGIIFGALMGFFKIIMLPYKLTNSKFQDLFNQTLLFASILFVASEIYTAQILPSWQMYTPGGCSKQGIPLLYSWDIDDKGIIWTGYDLGEPHPEYSVKRLICPKPNETGWNPMTWISAILQNFSQQWVNQSSHAQARLQEQWCYDNRKYCVQIAKQNEYVSFQYVLQKALQLNNFLRSNQTLSTIDTTQLANEYVKFQDVFEHLMPSSNTTDFARNTVIIFGIAAGLAQIRMNWSSEKANQAVTFSANLMIQNKMLLLADDNFKRKNRNFFLFQEGVTLGINDSVDVEELKNFLDVLMENKNDQINYVSKNRNNNKVKAALYWDIHQYLCDLSERSGQDVFAIVEKIFTLRLPRHLDLLGALALPAAQRKNSAQMSAFKGEPTTHEFFEKY